MRSSQQDVENFLEDVRHAIDAGQYSPIDRAVNMRTLTRLGIMWSDAIDEIYNLKFSDYIKGPEIDRDRPNQDMLWVFKKRAFGENIYIKIKVLYQFNESLVVISFHIDE